MHASAEDGAPSNQSLAWLPRATALAFFGLSGLLFLVALLIAVALPYGEWDAMALGTWSREIATHWPTIHFSDIYFADYNRPLFFVTQGFFWHVFGFHQAVGRIWSLAFALLLAAAICFLARDAAKRYASLAAATAVLLLFLVRDFDLHVASGLTDVPAAALVATTVALLRMRRLRRAQPFAIATAAAGAVLTKPSALPALVGVCCALALGARSTVRGRVELVLAIAGGVLLALLYDVYEARRLGMGLWAFLSGYTGTEGSAYYARLADEVRTGVLLGAGWLGTQLRLLLLFAVAYAVVRLVTPRHRLAVGVAFPVAVACALLGPRLASTLGSPATIPSSGGGDSARAATILLDASLLFSLNAPRTVIPTRLQLARLLTWAAPTFALWLHGYPFETRALAPAWPPMILLMTLALVPAFAGAFALARPALAVPALALIVLGAFAAYNINGLGSSGWRQLRSAGVSGFADAALMRNVALGGDFSAEVNALAPQVTADDRILTSDGRLRFFYLDQVDLQEPRSCSQLAGHRLFVLLEDDEIRALYGRRAESSYWESCKGAGLTKVDERPGAFAIFVRGAARPTVGGCGVSPETQTSLAIEFGRTRTSAAARLLLSRVAALGFVQAKVEQLGCSLYRVVETGIPDEDVAKSILAETQAAHLSATLVRP